MPASPLGATCPSCRASVRLDADWCSLCFAVLRVPAPSEPPAPAPEVAPRHAAPDPLTAPLLDVLRPQLPPPAVETAVPAAAAPVPDRELTWPCTSCGTSNPLAAQSCGVCGSGFLAGAASRPTLVLPGVGDLGALSRGQRIGGALAVLAAVLVPVALVTFLLTGSAPTSGTPTPEVTQVTGP